MSVLVKTIHAAIAEGKDPTVEVRRWIMNYRNTLHPSTGKAPNELTKGRLLKTKILALIKTPENDIHKEAQVRDKM